MIFNKLATIIQKNIFTPKCSMNHPHNKRMKFLYTDRKKIFSMNENVYIFNGDMVPYDMFICLECGFTKLKNFPNKKRISSDPNTREAMNIFSIYIKEDEESFKKEYLSDSIEVLEHQKHVENREAIYNIVQRILKEESSSLRSIHPVNGDGAVIELEIINEETGSPYDITLLTTNHGHNILFCEVPCENGEWKSSYSGSYAAFGDLEFYYSYELEDSFFLNDIIAGNFVINTLKRIMTR